MGVSLPILDIADPTELASADAGPKRTTSLLARGSPLASPQRQQELLRSLRLGHTKQSGHFGATLAAHGWPSLRPAALEIFQINIGKLCNMTCRHCHVDSGPDRAHENMDRRTVDACLRALDQTSALTVDITGGAPELNPNFRYLVEECIRRGKQVIDRCNLSVLLLPRCADLSAWLAERGVAIVASLPHYARRNTDAQRGEGAFDKSIAALRALNAAGYGAGNPKRQLTLMVNPVGAFLAGDQAAMEREWRSALRERQGVSFDRLIALNNMPISRYLEWLEESGNLLGYMELLVNSFNPGTISGLMCRNTLSVSWDGRIFDCDFNQMLDLEWRPDIAAGRVNAPTIFEFTPELLERRIVTGRHCFGCTAGAGSSCGGALA